ncbi:MAG: hypothetical protein QOH28_1332 [Actinomycetota bacterium]|jgi:hypothetical protein|nr:hypothetical protein [Actinomycetota bacterium]
MIQEAAGRTADEQDSLGSAPPSWLRLLALAAAAGVLTFGAVGLLLAVNGWYRPALAFPIGAVAWVAVLVLARPALVPEATVSRGAHVYAALGVAAILAITAWNSAHASQHVLINRDGGSYANTARWIARDGSLAVKPRVGPFANPPTVGFDSFAVYEMPDGSLQFQFAHLLPVVLAEAFAIRGDAGLFHAPEVLGGIALLAFYVLAWRLFRRPLFALAAMLALAFIIPQVSFSRDSYSEIPSQILLFTALWLLVTPRLLPKWRVALASGLFLGALEATRIDAIVFLIGVPVLLLIAWLRADRDLRRRDVLPATCAFVAGLVPGLTLGFIDLTRHSGMYYADLSDNVRQLVLVAIGCAFVCACALVAGSRPGLVRGLRRLPWPTLATSAAALVGCAGFFAWIFRPRIQHLHVGVPIGLVGGLQAAEHVAVDPTRTYFERSLTWMGWYLGPLTLAVAIIGAALLVRELLLGRMTRVIGVLVVLAPGSILYLYKADAVPDHVWVTRRFLVSAFPLLVLLALGLAAACAGTRPRERFGAVPRVAAILFAILAVAYPVYTVIGLRSMSEERGFLAVVHDACADIGPHAAVVVLERDEKDLFDDWTPQALRSWCGAEVGVTRGPARPDALSRLARAWNAQGRRLFVVALSADTVRMVFPGATISSTRQAVNTKIIRQTLTHRPDAYTRQTIFMAVAAVPTG